MSELKDKLTREVEEIDKVISNQEEKTKVQSIIQEMIGDFTRHIVTLTERQNEMDEKVTEIYDMLSDIESELVENFIEDLQGECPYCGEVIPLEFKDGEFVDFECPKCHNLIEMEMMLDEHHCDCCDCEDDEEHEGCDGHCEHCEEHHDEADED